MRRRCTKTMKTLFKISVLTLLFGQTLAAQLIESDPVLGIHPTFGGTTVINSSGDLFTFGGTLTTQTSFNSNGVVVMRYPVAFPAGVTRWKSVVSGGGLYSAYAHFLAI